MKKILIITTISGFLPQFESNDVKLLMEAGYEVHYASNFKNPIYHCDKEVLRERGIILHQIDVEKSPLRIRNHIRAFRQLRKILETESITAIHCHNPMGGVLGRLAALAQKRSQLKKKQNAANRSRQKNHIFVLYTAHGFHFYRGASIINWLLYYSAERFLAHFTNELITINREDYLNAKKFRLRRGGQVSQIHGVGVDANRFRPMPQLAEEMRRELAIPKQAFHIVTAAELNDNKNQSVIIESIAAIGRSDIYYSICGKGPNENKLRELIQQRNLEKQVRLLGYRNDMEKILAAADCFAFPSKREGLGIAAVEALLCEVPLIAADNRGTREYLIDGVNGILCRNGREEEFQKAILMLFEDKELRLRLKANCRNSVRKFTIPETEKRMRSIYDRIP